MNSIYLRHPLEIFQKSLLQREFPLLKIIDKNKELTDKEWLFVEIFYGNSLSKEELDKAPQLHWIHVPSSNLKNLCLKEIKNRGNILITLEEEPNAAEVAEFVLAGVISFSKNLFYWRDLGKEGFNSKENQKCDLLWSLKNRIFLQIGLGKTGSAIAEYAQHLNMRVFGVQRQRSFHPNCYKTLNESEVHSILPVADVVSLALPEGDHYRDYFGYSEFKLMKPHAIFSVVGADNVVEESAIIQVIKSSKLRGVLLDGIHFVSSPALSQLAVNPNVLITPGIAGYPKKEQTESFRIFTSNLRQFLHGGYHEVSKSIDWNLYL